MDGSDRRELLVNILRTDKCAVSGTELAKQLHVSRQVIVQDIALIRAKIINIVSTNKGYIIEEDKAKECSRTFKVIHSDEDTETELNTFVDLGGHVKDVFIYHKIYGVVKAEMNIKSRKDVRSYMENIKSGKSSLLKNVTSGYHYHTIVAEDEETLDLIQAELEKLGFLAKLTDYEPVDFWKNEA